METYERTDRTQVRRMPERGHYEKELVHSILDEGLICHLGFVVDGKPLVIPTIYGRLGETLYIHGSVASRMLRSLKDGVDLSLTVTLVDGLVLARSSFHHSMNYRSVVVFGRGRAVMDPGEKETALDAIVDHVVPGRRAEVRKPNAQELAKTLVIAVALEEVSAKVRSGPPLDDEADYELPVWAGVIPLRLAPEPAVPDPKLDPSIAVPEHVLRYAR